MNEGVKISTQKYIVYAHDDMYFCPNWDTVFVKELNKIKQDDRKKCSEKSSCYRNT